MQISWSLLCCTILQAAYYVDILVITLLHNTVGSRTMQISWSLLCCTILQAEYYVDILVITLLHNIVGSVLCRYLGHYFAAQYCRQRTMQISWSLLCCTILQAAYYVDIWCYFAAQYCRQRTMQISWSLLCCTILQAAYYVDILVITLLHNIVGSVLCRYLGSSVLRRYLVVTLLHNTVGSVLCRYLGRYFAAQYCRQRTMQISWSLLCCTILQAAYYVDILVITLLHNIVGSVLYVDILVITLLHNTVGSVLCRYLGHYFAAQYCKQRTMQISWSLLCCTILQAAYYVDILVTILQAAYFVDTWLLLCCCRQRTMIDNLVITLLHNIVGSVLCRYLGHYFAAQYCGSVLCRYLGHYFAAQYCRQRTMQISQSLLCCTILQTAYYIDNLGRYFAAQYCRQRTMQISWSLLCCTILLSMRTMQISQSLLCCTIIVGSVLCRYLGHYFAAQYCRQRTMQISWSLLCCTILQAVFYEVILVITLLHNIVVRVQCRYFGHYFAAQYCRQRTMQISWSLLCCTILVGSVLYFATIQAAYVVWSLLCCTISVGSVLCRYLVHYFAAQYCRQRTMQISLSLLCCTIMQAAYYVDILVITLLHNTVGSVLCKISWSLLCCTILQAAYYVDILVITLLHNTVGSVICRYLGHYFAAQYCWQRTLQMSWSLLCCTILQAAYYVDILVITLLHNTVGSVLCRYLGHYFAAQYCRQRTMQISWSLLCCTILQAAYYVDILVITLLHNIAGSGLCR